MVSLGKKFLVYGICTMLGSPFMVTPSTVFAAPVKNSTEITIYEGGTIYTMQETVSEVSRNIAPKKAEVVVVEGDKIVYVGDKAGASAYNTRGKIKFVNLNGNVMLPGFVDSHSHFPSAVAIQSIDVNPTPISEPGIDTLKALQDKLLAKAKERGYKEKNINWIQAFGYDDTMLDILAHPSQEQLSEGELGNYNVHIIHISGHMAVTNTKALKKLFDEKYIQGALTTVLQKQARISPTNKAVSAKLVNSGGQVQYEVTLQSKDDLAPNKGDKVILPGLQMKPNAVELMKEGKTVECFTGLLIEGAQGYIVPDFKNGDMVFIPKAGEEFSYASKDYASKGVTTADNGGANDLAGLLKGAQKAIVEGKMKLRLTINPRVYSNLGTGISEATLANHYALGWTGMKTDGDAMQRTIGTPGADSPKMGGDLTIWNPGDGTKTKPGSKTPEVGSAAETLQKAGIKDRLFLGSWKYTYDGSIQGYTGYLSASYYKKPVGVPPFNPAGRTGKGKDAHYVIGGTVSVNDPQFFCRADSHYGNENALSTSTYDIGAKTVMDYHTQKQSVAFHLNGSWANDDVVNFIEQAVAKNPDVKDSRHTIIHAQMQELQHIQRFMGNYTQFPISSPEEVKKFGSVWTGVNAMEWQEDKVAKDPVGKDYYPTYGKYLDKFDTKNADKGMQLRSKLQNGTLMRDQHIISSYFVDHTYYWGERHRDIFMGPGRAYNMSPMGWAVLLKHRYAMHNDTGVTPQKPLLSIVSATTRMSSGQQPGGKKATPQPIHGTAGIKRLGVEKEYPATFGGKNQIYHDFDQRITVLQALHAITVNSAFQHKLDDKVGQIKEGLFADFVILGQDPFQLEKEGKLSDIANIPVLTTIVGNEVVFGFLPGTQAGDFVGDVEPSYYNDNSDKSDSALSNIKEEPLQSTDEEAIKDKAGKGYFGSVNFTAEIKKAKQVGVFTTQIMGNDLPLGKLHVEKFVDQTKKLPFTLVDKVDTTKEGLFWVTDRGLETLLTKDSVLKAGTAYYVHFTVQDNGQFDTDKTDKKIKDPTFIYADALPKAPSAGNDYVPSSGSGCTVGTNVMYDFVALVLIALGLVAVRTYRSRRD